MEKAVDEDRLLDCSRCDHNPDQEKAREILDKDHKEYRDYWEKTDKKRDALASRQRKEKKNGGREMEETKHCSKCGQTKNKSEFSPDKKNRDKLRNYCKKCTSTLAREYQQKKKAGLPKTEQNIPKIIPKPKTTPPAKVNGFNVLPLFQALKVKIQEVKDLHRCLVVIKEVADPSLEIPPYPFIDQI
jgi:hypothetical protein